MRRAALILLLAGSAVQAASTRVLDDFRHPGAWRAEASDQVRATLRHDARGGLCLAYDFNGVSGYAVARRALAIDWPAHPALALRLHGTGGANDIQLKFVDASGENVWWHRRANTPPPAQPSEWRIPGRALTFAWGPTADKSLRRTAGLELAVAAGRDGGRGEVCLQQLSLTAQDPPPATWPAPTARADRDAAEAAATLDGDAGTAWSPGPGRATLQIDHGTVRELDGVALHWWKGGTQARTLRLEASDDGRHWRLLRRVDGAQGPIDTLHLPDERARHLRLVQLKGGDALAELQRIEPGAWPDTNAMLKTRALALPRGTLPRAFLNEQSYWTVVGVDGGGARSGLLDEDGAAEAGVSGFSLVPALRLADGTRIDWAAVQASHQLRDGFLPMPSVHWQHPQAQLSIAAAADGPAPSPVMWLRYRVQAPPGAPLKGALVLGLRPWQVNPPQQFLNTPGGAVPLRRLAWRDQQWWVDGQPRMRALQAPDAVELRAFDAGLAEGEAPGVAREITDPQALASGALAWTLDLAPGEARTIAVAVPLGQAAVPPETMAGLDARFERIATAWRQRLGAVTLQLPAAAQRVADSLRSAMAQILISRDGPALQPGTRSYARSWIRDGAMMVEGLLRAGEAEASRDFVDWFGERLFANGKVPCCIDRRGADPVPENDSHGQYLHAVMLVWQHTGDRAFLQRHWPRVQRVVAYMESLRQSERTDANRAPGRDAFFGLMPASISHEGYSEKPMHSYWDNFWALRGYRDAPALARAMGDPASATRWAGWRDEFATDLRTSIARAMQAKGITFIPGAAELGDFDATSTTVALSPAQADDLLPAEWLQATFERYWQEAEARRLGQRDWADYTPYELRSVGALLRLGQGERAWQLLDFFFADQRPAGWNQWAEVVMRRPRQVHFLGDMPHAWVSSDYLRSALDALAYEREHDRSLVIGAGLRAAWLGEPWAVRGLRTSHGPLGWSLTPMTGGWTLAVQALDAPPAGGLRLRWPEGAPLPTARDAQGQTLPWQGRELALPAPPLTITLESTR
ncbi:discoidin domain-containing protein [Ideonella alba]|uniref:Discoidin domain-containing protein n=1 Tax=Ideonella alba TaxID=2824118 RepID=A0A941BAJ7_9BURK|nr:discoidin domain-containing protein [Ideonella alba]MBQ0929880.1 discoidin domain-containing protein [Ideonella alba]